MSYTVGVDIGGTKMNFVLLHHLKVIKTRKMVTPQNKAELISAVEANIKRLTAGFKKSEILGIGLGVTGPLDRARTVMLNPPNQKYLQGCRLAAIIEKDLQIKTVMDNDVKCFVLGEVLLGAGKGAKIVSGITLGTGLGAGLVINNKIYRGSSGAAGELGHMAITCGGPRCSCGSVGCFEEYGSERFFKKRNYSPKELGKAARGGDEKALKIFKEYGHYLGIGLSNAINLFDPEVIVLGGGIANVYEFFIKEAEKEIQRRVISPMARTEVKIKKTKLGDLAGAIGAALLFHKI